MARSRWRAWSGGGCGFRELRATAVTRERAQAPSASASGYTAGMPNATPPSSTAPVSPLTWRVDSQPLYSVCSFDLGGELLTPRDLGHITLPPEISAHRHLGLVLSGRGPVWLYAHLSHLTHDFAWLGIHDPRLQGAVVVARHRADAPRLGQIVPLA